MGFSFSEKYKLELRWSNVLRPKAGLMHFTDAYFCGPVLAFADKIQPNDGIKLDFCHQMIILVKDVYVADLRWGEVEYRKDKVILNNARLTYDPELKGIPNLKNKDHLVINTKGHERENHPFNLLYEAFAIDIEGSIYDYRR